MADFLNRCHNVSDYAIKDIDHKFICDFEAYLISNYHLAENTRIGYLNRFRHVVSIAIEDEIITKNPFVKIPGQHKITDREYLTQEEVEKVTNAKLEKITLEQTRDIFIFCCFTGLSYIDISLLTRDNIILDFDGKLWIKGSRQKTGGEYNIPLLNVPKAILEKYRGNADSKFIFPVPKPATYNYRLRKIAKICGIDKEITSHLACHTFATTITLTKGVPMETVSKMLGHKNLKTTQIYARVINRKISDDMLALSERLSDMENKLCVNF
jgi:integrase